MPKPFDGAISAFFDTGAPDWVRDQIKDAKKGRILDPGYPYPERLDKDVYEDQLEALQIELVKAQAWVKETGQRIAVVFEGRDAAGKGGSIKRVRENLNPRVAHVVALAKPSDREAGQWYFQRYIQHLPTAGEITLFDRSWYNRRGGRTCLRLLHRARAGGVFRPTPQLRADAGGRWHPAHEDLAECGPGRATPAAFSTARRIP